MTNGFLLKRWLALTNWHSVPIFDYAIEQQPTCPVDGAPLSVVAAITSQTTDEQIRIGCCPTCGLVGYMDRPSGEDVGAYYRNTWMGESEAEALAQAHRVKQYLDQQADQEMFAARRKLVAELPIDKSRPVLEVGCGYGRTIHELRLAGYRKLVGIESCPARAKATMQVYDVPVRMGDFLDPLVCRGDVPYSLIASHHVLEHSVNPDAFIARCAELQSEGDYLVLSLPNFLFEPSMGVLFFWPHLWSFNLVALWRLLLEHGYLLVEPKLSTDGDLYVLAQRHAGSGPPLGATTPRHVVAKLLLGLGLAPAGNTLVWQRDCEGANVCTERHAAVLQRSNFPRIAEIGPLENPKTDAPIEIQFEGRIELCQK